MADVSVELFPFQQTKTVPQVNFLYVFALIFNCFDWIYVVLYRVYKKNWTNRSQRREAAQSMKFLINIDCFGTYDVE